MAIVTSTYRYKRPPRKQPVAIEAPAIITVDPKTRVPEKGRRPSLRDGKAAEVNCTASGEPEAVAQSSTKPPQPANDDGPRQSAIVTAKKGPRLRDERTAAQVVGDPPRAERAGAQQPNPPTTARKSAIVTVRDRKTVQCQREQQHYGPQTRHVKAFS
jgi:hypothetical protein